MRRAGTTPPRPIPAVTTAGGIVPDAGTIDERRKDTPWNSISDLDRGRLRAVHDGTPDRNGCLRIADPNETPPPWRGFLCPRVARRAVAQLSRRAVGLAFGSVKSGAVESGPVRSSPERVRSGRARPRASPGGLTRSRRQPLTRLARRASSSLSHSASASLMVTVPYPAHRRVSRMFS